MTIPHDLGRWLEIAFRFLVFLAPSGFFSWRLLANITAHSICLSGQRDREYKDQLTYRFAIQNNEDVPLARKRCVRIEVLDMAGRFLDGKTPHAYVGCNPIQFTMDSDLKTWSMNFDELPALDTWSIVCATNEYAQNVRLSIEDVQPPVTEKAEGQERQSNSVIAEKSVPNQATPSPGPRLSHSGLLLPADQDSVFVGRETTPEPGWAAAIVIIAFGIYAFCLYGRWTVWDFLGPVFILIFAFTVWSLTRRPAPSISQGYWTPTHPVPKLEPGSETRSNSSG